jgi:DNA-directed RNA polymerase subunit beta
MQAQAVPLLRPDIPQVSTAWKMMRLWISGQVIIAEEDGGSSIRELVAR